MLNLPISNVPLWKDFFLGPFVRPTECKTLVGADLNSEVSSSSFFHFFHFFKKFENCENSAEADLEVTSELTSTPRSPPANFSLFSFSINALFMQTKREKREKNLLEVSSELMSTPR